MESTFPSISGLLFRLAISLGLIITLIWGTVYLLRRISTRRVRGSLGGAIRVLERSFIAPKKEICLVKVAGKVIALGITDSQITLLAELPTEETLDYLSRESESPSFLRDLGGRLNLWKEKDGDEEEGQGSPSRLDH